MYIGLRSLAGGKCNFEGKGKGKGPNWKTNAFAVITNLRGADGQVMTCHECGSESHLADKLLRRAKGSGRRYFDIAGQFSSSSEAGIWNGISQNSYSTNETPTASAPNVEEDDELAEGAEGMSLEDEGTEGKKPQTTKKGGEVGKGEKLMPGGKVKKMEEKCVTVERLTRNKRKAIVTTQRSHIV